MEKDGEQLTPWQIVSIPAGIVLIFGAAFLWFAAPWIPRDPLGGAPVNRYDPLTDGRSALYQIFNSDGEPIGWESHNYDALTNAFMLDIVSGNSDLYASLSHLFGLDPESIDLIDYYNINSLTFWGQNIVTTDLNGKTQREITRVFTHTDMGQHLLFGC